jgi:hypothetical protein
MAVSQQIYRVPALLVVGTFVVVAIVGLMIYLARYGTPLAQRPDAPAPQEPEVREAPEDLQPLDDPQPEPDLRLEPEPRTQPMEEPAREPAPGPYPPPATGGGGIDG